ncbi:hypothetical protein [Rhodoferax sp. GW822-FHT02A01]|uniref:hypothetical protein n=1 Tax=Rhodoferax sp. GW822-FHT02A01 TaxID=3141537 RepID=UPI00315CB101
MELLLTRNQKSGLVGGIKFLLTAKARLTDEELDAIKKYKLSDTLLYEKPNDGPNMHSITSMLAYRFAVPRLHVHDLVDGKTIEGKDVVEILDAEEQIIKAAEVFHKVLTAAKSFGGETVHTFEPA